MVSCRHYLPRRKGMLIIFLYVCVVFIYKHISTGRRAEQSRNDMERQLDKNHRYCRSIMEAPRLVAAVSADPCDHCEPITCGRLLTSNASSAVVRRAVRLSRAGAQPPLPDAQFTRVGEDCAAFVRRGRYHMTAVGAEEAGFPIAFNIIMHRNVQQLELLLRAIYRPQNAYCLHVDAGSPQDTLIALMSITSCLPNVFVSSRLEHVVYAGFSRLQADVNCMRDHLRRAHPAWRYVINMAGEAFPLRTNLEMVRILKIYNGANDVEGMSAKRVIWSRLREYIEVTAADGKRTLRKTGKPNPPVPHGIKVVRGSAYAVLSREFVAWALSDRKARDLLEWAKRTYSPDEFYWATLHHYENNPQLQPPGGYIGPPGEKPWLSSYSAWAGDEPCAGRFVRGVCIFGVADLSTLTRRLQFAANKFYVDFEPLALECMQAWIERNTVCPRANFDYDYYRKLAFIRPPDTGKG